MTFDRSALPSAEAILKDGPRRGQAARARALLPWIKAQLAAGHTQTQVVEALNESGVRLSLASLRKVLYPPRSNAEAQQVENPPAA